MTKPKFLIILTFFVAIFFAVKTFAGQEADEGRMIRTLASQASTEVNIRGLLSCEGAQKTCASIQLEDQSTGQIYRVTGLGVLQKLVQGGINLVTIQGERTAANSQNEMATINVKQIILF